MESIAKIRRAYFVQGKAICLELRVSRKVVRKVLRSKATAFRYHRDEQPMRRIGPCGRWTGCRRQLAGLSRWGKGKQLRGIAGIDRLQQHIGERLGYFERNQDMLVHYAARRRRGEPTSTAFVESAVNDIVVRRMNKKQQMRWNRATVQPFLDVRTAVRRASARRQPVLRR